MNPALTQTTVAPAEPSSQALVGATLFLAEIREAQAPAPAPAAAESDAKHLALRESIAKANTAEIPLREASFPLLDSYDLAAMMRTSGVLWADSQATGNTDDATDAATLAKTVKRVIERHPEIVQLADSCGCGPVCCC